MNELNKKKLHEIIKFIEKRDVVLGKLVDDKPLSQQSIIDRFDVSKIIRNCTSKEELKDLSIIVESTKVLYHFITQDRTGESFLTVVIGMLLESNEKASLAMIGMGLATNLLDLLKFAINNDRKPLYGACITALTTLSVSAERFSSVRQKLEDVPLISTALSLLKAEYKKLPNLNEDLIGGLFHWVGGNLVLNLSPEDKIRYTHSMKWLWPFGAEIMKRSSFKAHDTLNEVVKCMRHTRLYTEGQEEISMGCLKHPSVVDKMDKLTVEWEGDNRLVDILWILYYVALRMEDLRERFFPTLISVYKKTSKKFIQDFYSRNHFSIACRSIEMIIWNNPERCRRLIEEGVMDININTIIAGVEGVEEACLGLQTIVHGVLVEEMTELIAKLSKVKSNKLFQKLNDLSVNPSEPVRRAALNYRDGILVGRVVPLGLGLPKREFNPVYHHTSTLDVLTCNNPKCGAKTPGKKCSRCKSVAYCSKECQIADWKTHKLSCTAPS